MNIVRTLLGKTIDACKLRATVMTGNRRMIFLCSKAVSVRQEEHYRYDVSSHHNVSVKLQSIWQQKLNDDVYKQLLNT